MAGILAGKAALITGSTSGIGLAMARALAGAGANVCLHGLGDLSAIQKVQDELQSAHGVKTAYSDADLKKPALIRDMVKQVPHKAATGSPDWLPDGTATVCFTGCPLCRHMKSLGVSISW